MESQNKPEGTQIKGVTHMKDLTEEELAALNAIHEVIYEYDRYDLLSVPFFENLQNISSEYLHESTAKIMIERQS